MIRHIAAIALLAGACMATPAFAQQQESCDERLHALERRADQAELSSQQRREIDQLLESARLFQRIEREAGCLNVLAEAEQMFPAGQQAARGEDPLARARQALQQSQEAARGGGGQQRAAQGEDPLVRAREALQRSEQEGASGRPPAEGRPVVTIRLPRPEVTVRMPGSEREVRAEVRLEMVEPGVDVQQAQPPSAAGGGQDQQPARVGDGQPPDQGPGERGPAQQAMGEPARAPDQVAPSGTRDHAADMAGDQDVQSAQRGGGEQQQARVGAGAGGRQGGQDQPAAVAQDGGEPDQQGVTGGGLRADQEQPDEGQGDRAAGGGEVDTVAGLQIEELIGQEVENGAGETVGTVVDLVRQTSDQALFAVLSVGGFLGLGDKKVAVAGEAFERGADQNLVLPDTTQESLEQTPAYNHALYESLIDER